MAIKICLDAGHYAKYNQSPAVKTYYESEMNWTLHLLLKKYLEQYGISVITTRASQDKDLGLVARGQTAKGCNLFLSIHSNAVGSAVNEAVDYPLVCVPVNGSGTALGKKLADCITSVMGTKQKGYTFAKKASDGKSDWYSVIYGAASVGVPGLILEHSFHTNTRAAQWLSNSQNLDKLAKAEADVIAAHYGVSKPTAPEKQLYRIRKSWADAKSQIGAYEVLENAKKACKDGYTVYDKDGKAVWPVAKPQEPAPVTVKLPELARGSKGAAVKTMQILLDGYGYPCGPYGADGDFGASTENALKAYQKVKGLTADGICGPSTWPKLLGV